MPSTGSSFARPRTSRIFGGKSFVSIESATAGCSRRADSFGAFFAVVITISESFQTNAIGTTRGVPSLATYDRRVSCWSRSSLLSGWFRTSAISRGCMIRHPFHCCSSGRRPLTYPEQRTHRGRLLVVSDIRPNNRVMTAYITLPYGHWVTTVPVGARK